MTANLNIYKVIWLFYEKKNKQKNRLYAGKSGSKETS